MSVSFLRSVAEAYVSRFADLSDIMFVFPGRRAGTFFLKHIAELCKDRAVMLPRVATMSDFVETASGRVVGDRIELLFILYHCYHDLLKAEGVKKIPEFDSFRRWGETALADFNEVDMQDADPDAIFKNVKDIREISSNFLTEEQMKVMNEFFGQVFEPEQEAKKFWKTFTYGKESALHSKFRLLWQVLAPLYREFKRRIEEKGLTTSGGAYRMVADRFERGDVGHIGAGKIVMVGFNALTSAERRIFDSLAALKDEDTHEAFADFFWDAAGPVILDKMSAAGRYVQHGIRRWPAPDWALPSLAKSNVATMPDDLRVIAVPSNSMQTKVVSEVLADMAGRIPKEDFADARVAVVLPDEQLLMPMLYSLPEEIGDVNLTMGYPLRLSSVATFVSLLRRMESSRRKAGDSIVYYYKDLDMLLSHPFSRLLFGEGVTMVKEWMRRHHKYVVDIAEVREMSAEMTRLFRPLQEEASPRDAAEWLDSILAALESDMGGEGMKAAHNEVDAANIAVYRLSLRRMLEVANEYGMRMHWRTFLSLTDRLLASETVNFEGQPLKGLQVMGILETRALDFDRIVIPSLNERILPARRRSRTFISDSLRKAYGLPPVNYSESLFAYYFYRMIARAKEVVLLYDSRASEGTKSGDVSRYVLQLKYLYARDRMRMESRSFALSKSELKPSPIKKTDEIMDVLSSFTDPGPQGANLSATALTKYAGCQLKFYFENVLKIRTDEDITEYIDPITQGSVVHDVMQNIYLPLELQNRFMASPQVIDAALVKARMKDIRLIDSLVRRSLNARFFHLPKEEADRPLRGSSAHVAKILRGQVLGILQFDLEQTPFLLYGVEMDGNVSLKMADGRFVNMRYAVDRLDRPLLTVDGRETDNLRVVDYKTGTVHAETETMEAVFQGDYKGKNLLQLWLYANLFDALEDKNIDKGGPRPVLDLFSKESGLPKEPLVLELYDVSYISSGKHVYPKVGGEVQYSHCAQNAEFLALLEKMLMQLFDPESPFQPAADEAACRLCPFKTICWR